MRVCLCVGLFVCVCVHRGEKEKEGESERDKPFNFLAAREIKRQDSFHRQCSAAGGGDDG